MTDVKDPGNPPQYNPAYPPQQPAYPPQNPGYPPQQGYPPPQQQSPPPPYPAGTQAPGGHAQYQPAAPTQTVIVRTTQGTPPGNYLGFAIFVTVCCCLPFGIVGIVKASEVNSKWSAGDQDGAKRAAQSAKNWSIAGLVTGIIIYVIFTIIMVVYFVVIISIISSASSIDSTSDFDSYK